MPNPRPWQESWRDLLPFLRRLIVAVIVIAFALFLWQVREVLLLAFASVLVAILLLAEVQLLRRIPRIGHRLALTLVVLINLLVLGGTIWMSWPALQEQLANLVERLSDAVGELQESFGMELPQSAEEIGTAITGIIDRVWSILLTVVQAVIAVATAFVLVLVAGVFLAIDPATYTRGLVLLFPKVWHQKVREVMATTGRALRLWLQAQLVTMVFVGVLVGVGAWAIGLPSPLALGLIAGLTEFVPILGPIIGAAPAILLALSVDFTTLAWTVLLYVFVQQLESNVITPIVQRRVARIPPVLLLFSFVALGIIFGIPGIIIAAPLTIAVYVLIREFYVGELLDERKELDKSS
jgi:predicted PurR-regulated permease PerM